jgi:predicted ester cyclase
MSVEENKAIACRLIDEGWATGDLDIWDEICADDIVFGDIHDLGAYKQLCANFFAGFPERSYTIHDMVAEGDKVVVQITLRTTHEGKWAGVLPTNKQIEHSAAVIFRFAGDKIAEDQQISNMLSFWQQLGVIPPWEELAERANAKQA